MRSKGKAASPQGYRECIGGQIRKRLIEEERLSDGDLPPQRNFNLSVLFIYVMK